MIAAPKCTKRRSDWTSSCRITAMPMGTSMAAVAVLEIHIEMNAEAARMPKRRRWGSVPTRDMIVTAMRRCRFHCCIAAATHIPPRKRTM